MTHRLKISDVREFALDFQSARGKRTPALREFFLLFRYPREFTNPSVLGACSFYDLYIDYRFGNQPGRPGPPHPGVFADLFPTILRRLVGCGNTLTFFVKSVDRSYFDETDIINRFLAPRNLRYVLLANSAVGASQMVEPDAGLLFFEWPLEMLEHVASHWFMCPQVTIEGYIAPESPLALISDLSFRGDSEETVLQVIRGIDIGFRVWTDNNGLFLLTDKHKMQDIEAKLDVPSLEEAIAKTTRNYDVKP